MTKLPYLPLYLDAFGGAVAHLTLEEEGAYFRLLRLSWETPGCTIPTDPKWIARKLRVSMEDYQNVVVPILDEFFSTRRGRYYQKRLMTEWVKANDKVRVRSEAGKKGAAAKHQKRLKKPPDKRKANAEQTHSIPEPKGSGRTPNGVSTMNPSQDATSAPARRSGGGLDARRESRDNLKQTLGPDLHAKWMRMRSDLMQSQAVSLSELDQLAEGITAGVGGEVIYAEQPLGDRAWRQVQSAGRAEGLVVKVDARPVLKAIDGGKS